MNDDSNTIKGGPITGPLIEAGAIEAGVIPDAPTAGADEHTPTVEAGVLNAVAQECAQISDDHGFHEEWEDATYLEDLAEAIESGRSLNGDAAVQLRRIAESHRLLFVGTRLMLIVSEVAEGMESLRDTGVEGHFEGQGNLGEELADAQVRIGDITALLRIAVGDELMQKIAVNKQRPHKHGRKT